MPSRVSKNAQPDDRYAEDAGNDQSESGRKSVAYDMGKHSSLNPKRKQLTKAGRHCLRKYDDREPCGYRILKAIHAADDNCPLLIVRCADLVCP